MTALSASRAECAPPVAASDARQLQQVLDQQVHARALAADAREVFLRVRGQGGAVILLERLRPAADAAQRRAQVVRHGVTEALQLAVGELELAALLVQGLLANGTPVEDIAEKVARLLGIIGAAPDAAKAEKPRKERKPRPRSPMTDAILNMWADERPASSIAKRVGCTTAHVKNVVKYARVIGDPRAVSRWFMKPEHVARRRAVLAERRAKRRAANGAPPCAP